MYQPVKNCVFVETRPNPPWSPARTSAPYQQVYCYDEKFDIGRWREQRRYFPQVFRTWLPSCRGKNYLPI